MAAIGSSALAIRSAVAMPTLAQVRRRKFLTQVELAERSDVAASTIAAIEAGRQAPRISTARKLAAALSLEPGEIDWPEAPNATEQGE